LPNSKESDVSERNTIHISATATGLFDIEIFPIGSRETIEEKQLTAAEVMERLLAAPDTIDILSVDERGDDVGYHDAIQAEMVKHKRTFVRGQPCNVCGDSGAVGGAACPSCSVPWRN
jgi:hypothetical protein